MPLTTLDAIPALLVIDLQKGMLALPTVHPLEDVIARSAQLARCFRERGWPVVLVNVTGGAPGRTDAGSRGRSSLRPDWTEFVPELEQHSEDVVISKQRPGAFLGTRLDEILRSRGVTQVFLAGVATSGGVLATAHSARDLGYHVVLVADAMTDGNPEAHRLSVEALFPRIGESDTTEGVLTMLGR